MAGKTGCFFAEILLARKKNIVKYVKSSSFFCAYPEANSGEFIHEKFDGDHIRSKLHSLLCRSLSNSAVFSVCSVFDQMKRKLLAKNIHPTQKRSECSQSSWWLVFMCFVLLFIAFQLNFFPLAHSSKRKKNIMLNIFSLDLRNCILNSIYPILVASWSKDVLHFLEQKIQYGLLQ